MAAPRRAVLRNRLIEFGKAAERKELPFDVLQILGFGSFFRGKESPRDVDLVLRVDRHPARFALFRELIEKLQVTPHYEDVFESPQRALLDACDGEPLTSKWPAGDSEQLKSLFCQWLEAYTWSMLHPSTDAGQHALMSPDHFARRLIRRRFPNLNVVEILDEGSEPHVPLHIFHGFEVTVWTKDSPDISVALDTVLTEDAVRQNANNEIRHFGLQQRSLMAQIDLRREEIAVLRDQTTPPPPLAPVADAEWHSGIPRLTQAAAASEQAHAASVAFRTGGTVDPDACIELNSTDSLALVTQADEARTVIKSLQEQLELWTDLKEQFRLARHEPNVGAVGLEELAAALMLNHGPSQLRPRKRSFLNLQGFPGDVDIDDTLLRSRRG